MISLLCWLELMMYNFESGFNRLRRQVLTLILIIDAITSRLKLRHLNSIPWMILGSQ
jgi:hypothetical protein